MFAYYAYSMFQTSMNTGNQTVCCFVADRGWTRCRIGWNLSLADTVGITRWIGRPRVWKHGIMHLKRNLRTCNDNIMIMWLLPISTNYCQLRQWKFGRTQWHWRGVLITQAARNSWSLLTPATAPACPPDQMWTNYGSNIIQKTASKGSEAPGSN